MMKRLGRHLRAWGAAEAAALGVVGAAIFQALYNGDEDHPVKWVVFSILCAAVAAVAPLVDAGARARRRRTAKQRVDAALRDQIVAINDALDPLVDTLGGLVLSRPEERPAALQRLLTQALNSASQVVGRGHRTRVSFFQADAAAEPYRLVCKASAGRHGRPTTVFRQDRPDGEWVISLLANNEHHFCESVRDYPPPGWDASRKRTYETFISVPASVGNEAVGMITADAPNRGDLLEQDVPFLRVLGTIVAAAITIAELEE